MAEMRRRPPDLLILIATLCLLGIGIIAVGSAATPRALLETHGKNPFIYGIRQLIFAVTGLAVMFFMAKTDYRKLRKLTFPLSVVTFILLVLVLFMRDINGAHRWIRFGFFSLQPSELAKISVIFFMADYLSKLGSGIRRFIPAIVVPSIYMLAIGALIMKEPDFGTTLSVFMIFFAMLFVAGCRWAHLSALGLSGVAAGVFLVMLEPYRLRRLGDPMQDPRGAGWQIINSLMALGSGGLFGMGFGRSRQKFGYLPEAHTDYIFAIIGEELGLLGTLIVLGLFMLLAWRGFKSAMSAKDDYGCLLGVGITAYITFQALLNMAVVTKLLPTTGITLPLISYGGTSLWITLFVIGILLNISKGGELTREAQ